MIIMMIWFVGDSAHDGYDDVGYSDATYANDNDDEDNSDAS